MKALRPFWQYFGGKWRAAPRYPAPEWGRIIEPFAGAAGYSTRYPHLDVLLVEKYPVVAEMWRYLISVSEAELLGIPLVDAVDDLPARVPQGARNLVGFWLAYGDTAPRQRLSAGNARNRKLLGEERGWTKHNRARVASQLQAIRHWRVIEGDYSAAPDEPATWFIDAPYQKMGTRYTYGARDIDFSALSDWCRTRKGQAIVCEQQGADWLPFRPFRRSYTGPARRVSNEVIWTNDHD